jgi:hypothetical protein
MSSLKIVTTNDALFSDLSFAKKRYVAFGLSLRAIFDPARALAAVMGGQVIKAAI